MAAMFAGLRACFGRGAGESEPAPARTAMLGHAGAGPRLDAISIAAASCGSAVHARGVGAPPVLTLNAPAGPHDESAPPAEPGSNAAGAKSVMLAATSGQCGPSGAMALPAAAQAPEYGTSSSGGATATGTPPSSTAQLSAHIIPGKQAPSTLTPAASSSSWPALSPVTSARDESDGPLRLLLRRLAGSFNHPWPSASRALSGRPQQEELRSAATAPTPMSVPERAHAPSTRSLPPDAAAAALPPAVAGPPVPPAGRVMHRRGDTSVSDGMVWAATAGGPNGSGSGAGEGSASGGVGGVPAGGSMGLGSGQRTFSSWSLASSGGAGGAEGGERSLVSAALCRVTSGGSSSASPPLGGRASSGGSGGHGRDASASAALAEAEAAARQFATQFVQALLSGNVVWASHPLVADLLDGACEMVTHDGQLHQGRTAIIRRLNKGMEQFLQMLGVTGDEQGESAQQLAERAGQVESHIDVVSLPSHGHGPGNGRGSNARRAALHNVGRASAAAAARSGSSTVVVVTYTFRAGLRRFKMQDRFKVRVNLITRLRRLRL